MSRASRRPVPLEFLEGAGLSENGHHTTIDPDDPRGLTATISDAITASNTFAKDAGGKLYHYAAGSYKPDGDDVIAVEAKRLLKRSDALPSWTTHRVREVIAYIGVDANELWECPPTDRINVKNGILDIETRTLWPHSPDFLSPVQIPVVYDPDAACPGWDKFIGETFPEDSTDLAYEIPGWLIVPDMGIQKAILLLGEGANGKSTYLEAITRFIGDENVANLSLHKIENDRFSPARLVGKLANICPDLPSDHLSSSAAFKAIVGGDRIQAERKYADTFEMRPYSRLVFSANHPPRSGDASHAFYRRWLVIPFDRTFAAHERTPRSELDVMLSNPKELSGVLNRALDALDSVRERDRFSESESTKKALEEFQRETDPLSVWLDRNVIEGPDAKVSRDDLRRSYNEFAEKSGKPTMTKEGFGRAVARAMPDVQTAQRTYKGESNVRVYLGIGLRGPSNEDV